VGEGGSVARIVELAQHLLVAQDLTAVNSRQSQRFGGFELILHMLWTEPLKTAQALKQVSQCAHQTPVVWRGFDVV
jgi:hypothetical protein